VRLEVIDRATDDASQRLIELGLVARTTRASRPLWPAETAEAVPPPLSDTEREAAANQRAQAARTLKMARLLGDGGLDEEARVALLDAGLPLGRALAIESRMPELAKLEDTMMAPLAQRWRAALTPLRQFASDSSAPWKPVVEALAGI
jgi:hypothetical protein